MLLSMCVTVSASWIAVNLITIQKICGYFMPVLGNAPVSGVLNEHLASENSDISKFSGAGL